MWSIALQRRCGELNCGGLERCVIIMSRCVTELATNGEGVAPFISILLRTLLISFNDESWPLRVIMMANIRVAPESMSSAL